MNLSYGVARGRSSLLLGMISVWGKIVRPLPEAVLVLIYKGFGLSSLPFNIARLIFCIGDLVAMSWMAYELTLSWEVVVYTLVLIGFHPALFPLYFDCGMFF